MDMFITVADLDVGRSKKNKGGEKKKKTPLALAFRRDLDSVTFVVLVDIQCFGMIFGVMYFLKNFGSMYRV